MSELDEIMDGKYEMRGFRIEGDTIGFDTPQNHGWNLSPRDIEIIIYTLQQELERYKNIIDELETYLQRKYCEYVDMESDDAFVISLVLDTLRELKGEDK